ncbi:GrdX family protein [Hafnia alvei]|uniref:GrdX family protein n=1 Tax=Hafnia alvei TaxID=569 RepID=UPI0024A9499B|nr:GrdX family protein [Hafnia alvei]
MNASYIISNNPAVYAKYGESKCGEFSLSKHEGYLQVLLAARDAIHQGHRLLIHPESGSVKPYQTPYRSLLLAVNDTLDMDSLLMIEQAIIRFQGFIEMREIPQQDHYSPEMLQDFQTIDLSLVTQGLVQTVK